MGYTVSCDYKHTSNDNAELILESPLLINISFDVSSRSIVAYMPSSAFFITYIIAILKKFSNIKFYV